MAKGKWIRVGLDLQPLESLDPWALVNTREKAVAYLIAGLSKADEAQVRDTQEEDLILFHLGWAMWVRKALGLWGQNTSLLRDLSPDRPIHADDASMILIRDVWERLQRRPTDGD